MKPSRKVAWLLAAASAALMVVSIFFMARRIEAFNASAQFQHYAIDIQSQREFRVEGWPAVSLTDRVDEAGNAYLLLRFAGEERLIPVERPPVEDSPGLGLYEEWFKALHMTDIRRDEQGRMSTAGAPERLVLVSRRPPPDLDPKAWGAVKRSDWRFHFYILGKDGSVEEQTLSFPTSDRYKKELARRGTPRTVDELDERTWQYQAALHAIPALNVPKEKFKTTAVKAMGWTLPAAGFGGLLLVYALVFALAPRKGRDIDEPADAETA